MDDTQISDAIHNNITARAVASINADLAKKWERERAMLALPSIAHTLNEHDIRPSIFHDMAIYVAQKVRRILRAHLGLGTLDPYTKMILDNALASPDHSITVRDAIGDLTGKKRAGLRFRHGSLNTASTQVCSSRAALIALGLIEIKEGKRMVFKAEHPLLKEPAV